jgi:hypothetical protein
LNKLHNIHPGIPAKENNSPSWCELLSAAFQE